MELVSIALALSKLVPHIAGMLGGDDAQEVATQVIDVAKQVTGIDDAKSALEQIEKNPELTIRFQQAMNPVIIANLDNETKRLQAVNETMRVEAQSGDEYVRRWRPTFGYAVCLTWAALMLSLSILVVFNPADASKVLKEIGELSFMWGIALSVLGINVNKRSQDKAVAAGHAPIKGIFQSITERWSQKGEK